MLSRTSAAKNAAGSAGKGEITAHTDRCLTLLIDGAALNVPEIHESTYKTFRSNVGRLSMQASDRLPEVEKIAVIRSVLREFESYRGGAETELKERMAGWRTLVSALLKELLGNLGIDPVSVTAQPLMGRIGQLTTAEDLLAMGTAVEEFLHPGGIGLAKRVGSSLKAADRTTANDNAAGLRGGGAAVERVAWVMTEGRDGFVVLFQLGCLEVIGERFGMDTINDCLMAVSAYLTESLHSEDAIFHWSDSTLLAVILGRQSQQILTAELQRIAAQNRDITISAGNRMVMLRVPLTFDLIPIDGLQSAEDINRLSGRRVMKW